jgi:hypothetical protein
MSDREKAGLHGPVRTCLEEAILPDNIKHLTTREYSPYGKILIFTARFGNSDGTEVDHNADLRCNWPADKIRLRQFARARP